ncbi:hypothetical protein AA12717_3187 [Gluconacetobacter sacchari DSM 12717]|uniref:Uncharacterized protein n=1 Tax=Gluconacetobacter sacchari DSM 12717 TaxID=1307940 RepID=A0ABQ0PAQ1_9PROT|nr:hypothetical protein AA12717_3187 [Gluconacetobacter sacchari DSM 12717]
MVPMSVPNIGGSSIAETGNMGGAAQSGGARQGVRMLEQVRRPLELRAIHSDPDDLKTCNKIIKI